MLAWRLRTPAMLAVGICLSTTACADAGDLGGVARPAGMPSSTTWPEENSALGGLPAPDPTQFRVPAGKRSTNEATTDEPTSAPTSDSPSEPPGDDASDSPDEPDSSDESPDTSTSEPPDVEPDGPSSDHIDTLEADVVELTNAQRDAHGCDNDLRVDDQLSQAARDHSEDMAARNYLSHVNPEGDGPAERAEAAGYSHWSAENIAMGYPTAEAVIDGWMDSDGHRQNILNCDSNAIGVGVAESSRGIYWTQKFGYQ
ncbi:CAP domain-containing protein [Actinobacteria bacterium YIM 96077]|uniref:CAP domain-containing protein n=1 Tax=Phytoactinopolyspora halophila TaxID=1981511 RepID=A0A329QZT6_9ACTN|nr:CAP domain-containing protein [Phytoactinopolyspora halophila]AYY11731.1 CAP domain-containing protein [Actinobacteria bacterium YIM 96077]RAW17835.1 CAP domain-containing protein [Phytoactinopolyspora halophila]